MATLIPEISDLALKDLRQIRAQSVKKWGSSTGADYIFKLKKYFKLINAQPQMGVLRGFGKPGTRSLPALSHIIFYRLEADRLIILRVIHQKQDTHAAISNDTD